MQRLYLLLLLLLLLLLAALRCCSAKHRLVSRAHDAGRHVHVSL
jgi:hypothetical protein